MTYSNSLQFDLKRSHLYAVYWIVPFALLLVAADVFLLENYLKQKILASNKEPLLIALIFGAPHIIASMFAYCDKEYVTFYRPNILGGVSAAIALSVITLFVLPIQLGLGLLAMITMHHFIGQQAGVARMFLGQPVRYFGLWQAGLLTNSWIIILALALGSSKDSNAYLPVIHEVLVCYALCTTLLSIYIVSQVKEWRSAVYLIMTQAMSLTVTLFFFFDYAFLVLLLPNFVHDITAYLFYTRHDANRREQSKSNIIYRLLKVRSSWIVVLLPTLSLALAFIFELFVHYIFLLTITYFHYYIEGVAWKRDTLHRSNIAVQF